MRRTINSTGRQRLERGDVRLKLTGPEAGPRAFEFDIQLDEYELPTDARVLVEASRQTNWKRFDFGSVGTPSAEREGVLDEFGSAQGVKFRVKVVAAGGDGPAARILAQADNVPAGDPDDQTGGESLLAIDWNDESMGDELYRVEFGESTPILRINKQMLGAPTWHTLTDGDAFRALALPAILRQILTHILLIEGEPDDEDGWRGQWLRLATEAFAAGGRPEAGEDEQPDKSEVMEWIDRAVEGYCRRSGVKQRAGAGKLIGEGES